ncbi:MAG: 6,7-dimethyl-8-ribityllumazine synthase [Gammaproteobacteria bacterium]
MSNNHIISHRGALDSAARIAIVASRFNNFVVDKLYDGAMQTLQQHNIAAEDIVTVKVPGAFEIPVAVQALLDTKNYDAVITLGAVIRGETPHFDYICNECAHGIAQLAIDYGVPVIFGVLTVDNTEQALDRAGDEESNKGSESAAAALEMIGVLRQVQ